MTNILQVSEHLSEGKTQKETLWYLSVIAFFKFVMESLSYFETSSSFEPQNYFSDTDIF